MAAIAGFFGLWLGCVIWNTCFVAKKINDPKTRNAALLGVALVEVRGLKKEIRNMQRNK